jgi:hypothetical protein
MINSFSAATEFRIGQAQHRDMRICEVDNGRLLGCATVTSLGEILVARRREQRLAEEDWLGKAGTHGIRKAESVKCGKEESVELGAGNLATDGRRWRRISPGGLETRGLGEMP